MGNKQRNKNRQEKKLVSTEQQTPPAIETGTVASGTDTAGVDDNQPEATNGAETDTAADTVQHEPIPVVAETPQAPQVQEVPPPVIGGVTKVEFSPKANNIIVVFKQFSKTMGPNYPLQSHEQANEHLRLKAALRALLTLEYAEFVAIYREVLSIVRDGTSDAWLPTCRFKNLPLAQMSKDDFYFYQHFMHIVIATADANTRKVAIRLENLKSLVKAISDDTKAQKLLTFYADRQ